MNTCIRRVLKNLLDNKHGSLCKPSQSCAIDGIVIALVFSKTPKSLIIDSLDQRVGKLFFLQGLVQYL